MPKKETYTYQRYLLKENQIIGFVDDNGKFEAFDKDLFKQIFSEYKGLEIIISIQKWFKKRSNKQNNYYRGVVVERFKYYFNNLGNNLSNEQVHELLKAKFLIQNINGDSSFYVKNTSALNTVEFEEYLEKCRNYAAEMYGFEIPLPNE